MRKVKRKKIHLSAAAAFTPGVRDAGFGQLLLIKAGPLF